MEARNLNSCESSYKTLPAQRQEAYVRKASRSRNCLWTPRRFERRVAVGRPDHPVQQQPQPCRVRTTAACAVSVHVCAIGEAIAQAYDDLARLYLVPKDGNEQLRHQPIPVFAQMHAVLALGIGLVPNQRLPSGGRAAMPLDQIPKVGDRQPPSSVPACRCRCPSPLLAPEHTIF